jgi:hypothetical protein
MDFSEDMNSIYLFLVIQFILFVFQNVCYLRIENFQYAEMISGSLLIILIFGYIGQFLLKNESNLLTKSIIFASFFSVWYYFTKYFANEFVRDKNGIINWNNNSQKNILPL